MRTCIMLTFGLKLWITRFKWGGVKGQGSISGKGLKAILAAFMSGEG